MAFLSPISYYQYRCSERLYQIRSYEQGRFTLKIFNVARERLFRRVFSQEALGREPFICGNSHFDVPAFLSFFFKNWRLPEGLLKFLDYTSDVVVKQRAQEMLKTVMQELEIGLVSKETTKSFCRSRSVSQAEFPALQEDINSNAALADTNIEAAKIHEEQKEYETAIACYNLAFQFTNRWEDYAHIPELFIKSGRLDKAALAYIKLAYYQLKAGNCVGAIQTLERAQKNGETESFILRALIVLYRVNQEMGKASDLGKKVAGLLSQTAQEKAVAIYKDLICYEPHEYELYVLIAGLVQDPKEKRHFLLKGMSHALERQEYGQADIFWKEACSEGYFEDELVHLELLRQNNLGKYYSQLAFLAIQYEERKESQNVLRICKLILSHRYDSVYYEKMVTTYQAVERGKEWEKRAKEHIREGQFLCAERIYLKGFLFFKTQFALPLASVLEKMHRSYHALQVLLQAGEFAVLTKEVEKISLYRAKILSLDPGLHLLSLEQKQGMTRWEFLQPKIEEKDIQYGIEVLLQGRKNLDRKEEKRGRTPFMIAARCGFIDAVSRLLKAGADHTLRDNQGNTALMHAQMKGHEHVVIDLIKNQSEVNLEALCGMTPLMMAIVDQNLAVMEALCEAGCNVNQISQKEVAFSVEVLEASWGRGHLLDKFKGFSAMPALFPLVTGDEKACLRGITPLMFAAVLGSIEGVNFLIRKGAEVSIEREDGMDALAFGAARGSLQVVEALLAARASFHQKEKQWDAFIMASILGQEAVVQRFCREAMDVNAIYFTNCTALIGAAQHGHAGVVRTLLRAGARIDICKEGLNACMVAADLGHVAVVQEFMKEKGVIDLRDKRGNTALMIAKLAKRQEVISLLESS